MNLVTAIPKPKDQLPVWAKCCSHAIEIIASWEPMKVDTKDSIITNESTCAMCGSVWPAQKAVRDIGSGRGLYVAVALLEIKRN